jgi:hypothetical protein
VGTDGQNGQKMTVIRAHWFIISPFSHSSSFLRKTFDSWSDLFSPIVPLPKTAGKSIGHGNVSTELAPDLGVLKKWEGLDWIYLVQVRDQWRALVDAVNKASGSLKWREIFN